MKTAQTNTAIFICLITIFTLVYSGVLRPELNSDSFAENYYKSLILEMFLMTFHCFYYTEMWWIEAMSKTC